MHGITGYRLPVNQPNSMRTWAKTPQGTVGSASIWHHAKAIQLPNLPATRGPCWAAATCDWCPAARIWTTSCRYRTRLSGECFGHGSAGLPERSWIGNESTTSGSKWTRPWHGSTAASPVTANKVPVPTTIILGPPETTPAPTQTRSAPSGSSFPVDIPGYAILTDKIAGGQQPFPDGIAWLKEAGFSTVIHLRQPLEDVSASRQLVERQNMAYKSLEISPQTLDASVLAALDRDIQAANGRPVFLFDRDGSRTGAIWIAYATRYLTLSETQAREQAARLGYRRENADPAWEQAISRLSTSR